MMYVLIARIDDLNFVVFYILNSELNAKIWNNTKDFKDFLNEQSLEIICNNNSAELLNNMDIFQKIIIKRTSKIITDFIYDSIYPNFISDYETFKNLMRQYLDHNPEMRKRGDYKGRKGSLIESIMTNREFVKDMQHLWFPKSGFNVKKHFTSLTLYDDAAALVDNIINETDPVKKWELQIEFETLFKNEKFVKSFVFYMGSTSKKD